jgi:hypothetical protein
MNQHNASKQLNLGLGIKAKISPIQRPIKAFGITISFWFVSANEYTKSTPDKLQKSLKQALYNIGYRKYLVTVDIPETAIKGLKSYASIIITILHDTPINKVDKKECQRIGEAMVEVINNYGNYFEIKN